MNKRGFTLIELMVVISIISFLSSVVLASLNTARGKGQAASIKQQLSAMRSAANLDYEASGNTFDDVCSTGEAYKIFVAAHAQSISPASGTSLCLSSSGVASDNKISNAVGTLVSTSKIDTPNEWAASVRIDVATNKYFCVDYRGTAIERTGRGISRATPPTDSVLECN